MIVHAPRPKDGRNRSGNRFEGLPRLRLSDGLSDSSPSLIDPRTLSLARFSLILSLSHAPAAPLPLVHSWKFTYQQQLCSLATLEHFYLLLSVRSVRVSQSPPPLLTVCPSRSAKFSRKIKSNETLSGSSRTPPRTITPPVGAHRVIIIVIIIISFYYYYYYCLFFFFILFFHYHRSDTLNSPHQLPRRARHSLVRRGSRNIRVIL